MQILTTYIQTIKHNNHIIYSLERDEVYFALISLKTLTLIIFIQKSPNINVRGL